MAKIFALLDCNNFFASCERVFDPSLRKRPLVILSNNDGCVIARSAEAKAVGIAMGEPVFKCEYLIKRHRVQMRSANFPLYADLSQRIMSVLDQSVGDLEVYSIDEAFFSLGDTKNFSLEKLTAKAKQVQVQVERAIGIPVSIGIAQTKTLAKLANHLAKKKSCGVYSFYFGEDKEYSEAILDYHLADIPLNEVWGLGFNYCRFLRGHGFKTVLDFKYADRRWVKTEMKVQGLRTCLELNSRACFDLGEENSNPKSIISSRSFGERVSDLASLQEAVANFVAIAAYKMRRANKMTRCIHVMLRVKKDPNNIQAWKGYKADKVVLLDHYTNASSQLISAAEKAVAEIFDPKLSYKKAGVVFLGLKDTSALQLPLLNDAENFIQLFNKNAKVNNLVDNLNCRFGNNTLFWAAMGNSRSKVRAGWRARQSYRSPAYTTDWSDIPIIS